MATDLTLERIQEMKETLFQAFNSLTAHKPLEPTSVQQNDPDKMAAFRRAEQEMVERKISGNADRLAAISNSFASLVLAEAALTTGKVTVVSQPNAPAPSSGREPRALER